MERPIGAIKRKASNENLAAERSVRPKQSSDAITLNLSEEQAFQILIGIPVDSELYRNTAHHLVRISSPEKRFEEGLIDELLKQLRANGADDARVKAARPIFMEALKIHLNDRFLGKIGSRLQSVKSLRNVVIQIVDAFGETHSEVAYPELRKQLLNVFASHVYPGTPAILTAEVSRDSGYGSAGNTPVTKEVVEPKGRPAPVVTGQPIQNKVKAVEPEQRTELEKLRERERQLMLQLQNADKAALEAKKQVEKAQELKKDVVVEPKVVPIAQPSNETQQERDRRLAIEKQREILKIRLMEAQRQKDAAASKLPASSNVPSPESKRAESVPTAPMKDNVFSPPQAEAKRPSEPPIEETVQPSKPQHDVKAIMVTQDTSDVDNLITEIATKQGVSVDSVEATKVSLPQAIAAAAIALKSPEKPPARQTDNAASSTKDRQPSGLSTMPRTRKEKELVTDRRKIDRTPTQDLDSKSLTCWYWYYERPPCQFKNGKDCPFCHEFKSYVAARTGHDPPRLLDPKDTARHLRPAAEINERPSSAKDPASPYSIKGLAASKKTGGNNDAHNKRPASAGEGARSEQNGSMKPPPHSNSSTPIVDILWNRLVPTTPEMRDKIIQTILTNILDRGRSQDFVTKVRDERNRLSELSLTDNAGLRSKLFGLFNTFHGQPNKIRENLEVRLRPLILANKDKFPDLPRSVFEKNSDTAPSASAKEVAPPATPSVRGERRSSIDARRTSEDRVDLKSLGSTWRPGEKSPRTDDVESFAAGACKKKWERTPKHNDFNMTCPFWHRGFCTKSASECSYKHYNTDFLAGDPKSGARPKPLGGDGRVTPHPPPPSTKPLKY